VDNEGNLWVSDVNDKRTVPGTPERNAAGDPTDLSTVGAGTSASGIAADSMGNVYAADVGAHRVRDTCGCVERWRLLRNREGKPRWPIDCARPGECVPRCRHWCNSRPKRRTGRGPDNESSRFSTSIAYPQIWRAGRRNRTALYRNFGLPLPPKETTLRAITLACNYGRACGYLTVDGGDVGDLLVAENSAHTYSVDAIRARGTQAGRS
jgi:hypothetical protein